MAQAVTVAKLFETKDGAWALGHAAVHARFAEADLRDHPATTAGATVATTGEASEDGRQEVAS